MDFQKCANDKRELAKWSDCWVFSMLFSLHKKNWPTSN